MRTHGLLVPIIQYYTSYFDDYWHTLYKVTQQEILLEDPFLYPYDISPKATKYRGPFADDSIYLFKGYDKKYHLHSLEIAQFSLACWIAWRNQKSKYWLKNAILNVNWLVENQKDNGSWLIKHKNPRYGDLEEEWCSSLCQALAISSLLRAYMYTSEKRYLECAFSAMEHMISPVNSGGTMRMLNENEFIYEEYPRKKISGVINGYISSIIAIYEINKVTQSYVEILSNNIINLTKILPYYDVGYWSLYSYDGALSSGFYHRYLITQLKSIIHIVDLSEYAKKYENYLNFRCASFALIKKIRSNII
jgi:hypothetical protein